jgi:propane monooxygenase reductase subunit
LRFVPALSDQDWDGETGLITDVVDRGERGLADVDVYVCGPPPMVDAAIELLVRRGVPEGHIYYDKFTTTADAEESTR